MGHFFLLGIVYLSFISLGLPDGVLGVAWPAIRADMGQPLAAVGYLTITITLCAAFSSAHAGALAQRLGTGVVVAASCLLTSLALLGMGWAPSFVWLVAMGIPLGLGGGAVDACLNHFVAQHYSSRHMSWLHGCWGIGATTGPLIMGVALAGAGGWTDGARTIGWMQLGLALVLLGTLALWRREGATPTQDGGAHAQPRVFKTTGPLALWLAPTLFLLYVSAEMGTGLWAASILVSSRGLTLTQAGFWVSVYFGSITVGRFAIGLVANRLGNRRLVRIGVVCAALGALLFALPALPAPVSMAGLVLMGLGCAPIFPSLMHETARRFPDAIARTVIGRQMMFSYAGGSVVPAAFGLLATWLGLGAVMPVVVMLLLTLLFLSTVLDRIT
jgi:fucose permease